MSWTIYYNPKCGTCRNTLEILKRKKIEPRIVEYLKTPPTLQELEKIVEALGEDAQAILRAKEPVYAELKLDKVTDRPTLLRAIVKHPILLQRPIVLHGNKAVV